MIKLNEIFEVKYGTKFDFNKMNISLNEDENYINFVSRTSQNNGVVCKVSKVNNTEPLDAGLITVTLGGTYVLSSFIQPEPFYTAQNVAVLIPKYHLTLNEKIFYCTCIKLNRFKYGAFGREANRTLKNIEVPDKNEIPKWINQIDTDKYNHIKESYTKIDKKLKLDIEKWKWFLYEELFDIERGKGPRKKDLDGTGNIPFITATDKKNGLTGFTNMKPYHDGNTIGVNRNGSVGEAFYQPIPFCSTEDVHIFKPKFEMNIYIALFLSTIIRKEKYRYNYGRKWGIQRMKKSSIKLPAKLDGTPDWLYMEKYIKLLPFSSKIE